jgi:hypothetical protein
MAATPTINNFGLSGVGLGGIGLLGSGLVSGLGSIVGGGKQAQAAEQAAQAQVQAAQIAQNTELQMFGTAANALSPFQQYGTGAISAVQQLTGTGPGASASSVLSSPLLSPVQTQWPMFQPTEQWLQSTPGYQFQVSQGTQSVENQMASKGLRMGGAFGTALQQYTTNLADTTYAQQLQNYLSQVSQQQQGASLTLNQRAQQYNMLTGQIGTGLSAAGALTGAAINTGGQVAQTQMASGAAQAAGIVGQANALTNAISGVSGAASNTALLYAMNQGGMFGTPSIS